MEELLRQSPVRDYLDHPIAQIFSDLGDGVLIQKDPGKKGFPNSFDTALYILPAFKPLHLRWISNPVFDKGHITHWQLTGIELNVPVVHETKNKMEQAKTLYAEQHERLYSAIIHSMPGLFYLFDENGKYLHWNRQLETVSGYNESEISKMSPQDFVPREEKSYITNRLLKVFNEGRGEGEGCLQTRSGQKIPYYFTGQRIFYEGKKCLIGMGINITEKKALEKKLLRQELNKQKLIAQSMIHVQEKERADIGKELHDNINQILSTTKLYLEWFNGNTTTKHELVERSLENLDLAIHEIRNISKALVPRSLGDLGLIASIHDLVENTRVAHKIHFEFYTVGNFDERVDDHQKLMLFRIIQEGVSNVVKHAKAKKLILELIAEENENIIELNISDDGIGFDPDKIQAGSGTGLSNILNRTDLFNGKVKIRSAPQKGCRLSVQIPFYNFEKETS